MTVPPGAYAVRGEVLVADPRLERFERQDLSRAVKVVAQSFHDGYARINLEELVVDESCAVVFSGGGQGSVLTQMEGSHPSVLRGQIIGEDGESLVLVNPRGFYIERAPFQNINQLTLIAALLNVGGNGSRIDELQRGFGGMVIEGLRLQNQTYDKVRRSFLPPSLKTEPLLEAPSSDLSRLIAAGAFMHIRHSSLELRKSIRLRFLKSLLMGSSEDVFSLDEASELRTEFLSVESLGEGGRLRVDGRLYLGIKGLKIKSQGDVHLGWIETQGPIDIETTGTVSIKGLVLKGALPQSLRIRARNIKFEYSSLYNVFGENFSWPRGSLELFAREDLETCSFSFLSSSVRIECGGDWIHGAHPQRFNPKYLVARVFGVLRQHGAIHAQAGYNIFAHRYEKNSSLLGTEESRLVVQDLAVLDSFEQGFLKSGRVMLRGKDRIILKGEKEKDPLLTEDDPRAIGYKEARFGSIQASIQRALHRTPRDDVPSERKVYPELESLKAFVNRGVIQAQETHQLVPYIRNEGEIHTDQYRIFLPPGLGASGEGRGFFINPGIFEARDAVWDDSRLFLSTGVFKVDRAIFKGGPIIVRGSNPHKTFSYRSPEGVYQRDAAGTFRVKDLMEVTPFYEFDEGYTPDYGSQTFVEDARRLHRLKTYRPFKITLEGGNASINRLVVQDQGGQSWDGRDSRSFLASEDADAVYLANPTKQAPLASSLEMRGGTLGVDDLSLQLEHVFLDPSEDESFPVFSVKTRAQMNIWGVFRILGTFQYLGREPLSFNFFPKVARHVSLAGYLDHWGKIFAPHAPLSLLGLGKGRGRIKVKDFYYMPYFQREDRLHGAEIRGPLEGVTYQHLLALQKDLPRILETHRVKTEQDKAAVQTRLLSERTAQEQAFRSKEVSATASCTHQVQVFQAAINATASLRDAVVSTRVETWMEQTGSAHKRTKDGGCSGGSSRICSRSIPIYRTDSEKVSYNHQIAVYQAQQAQMVRDSALWVSQTAAAIQALTVNTSQAIMADERARNAEVEEIARVLNGELEEAVRAVTDALGASAEFNFLVEAETCRFGVCAPDMQGAILAKTRVDLGDVIALKTGRKLSAHGRTFIEALDQITRQGDVHTATRALVLAQSRAPFAREMAAFLDAAGIKPGDIFGKGIQLGGARAEIGARLGLRGVTEEMVLAPQLLAVMTSGSIGSARAEVFSQDLVTAGEINVGVLRSFVQTIIDLGGRTNIEALEWGEIAHILRVSGSLNLTEPAILAARQVIRFLAGSRAEASGRLHVEAPHVETEGEITVHPRLKRRQEAEAAGPTEHSGLSIRAARSYTQRGGLVRAPLIHIEGAPVITLAGGRMEAEGPAVLEGGAVFQLPGHELEGESVSFITNHRLGVFGGVSAAQKVQLSVPVVDLRDLEMFRTPEVDVFLEGNLDVLMPTDVRQALYVHTKGDMKLQAALTFQQEATLVADGSGLNTTEVKGAKKLSIILRGPNSVFHNKGTVHSEEHLVLDAPRVLNEKRVIWLSDGRFAEFEGGDLTSDNLLEVHGGSYQGHLGRLEGHHVWVDVDDFYASGVTRARGTMVYDARRTLVERLQHTWKETVTHTTKKKGMFGSKRSSHTTQETRVQSYPEHLSGVLEAGTLIGDPRVDVTGIFPGRAFQAEPMIERLTVRGGRVSLGEGGMHLWVKDHFGTAPNFETTLTPYTSSAGTWGGKHHQSGFVSQEVATLASFISQGPIVLESEGTLSLQGAHFESSGVGAQGRIQVRARKGITFPGAKVRIEHMPQIKKRGMMLYDVRGWHEESVASHFTSAHGWVNIHSEEGDITGVEPMVRSAFLSSSFPFRGRNVSFTPLILESQETQVPIGSVVDGGLTTLASLAAAVATYGAGAAVAKGLFTAGTLGHSMVAGGFASLIGQASAGMVRHGGDPFGALEDIRSEAGLRSLATATLSAGLTHPLHPLLHVPVKPQSFGEFMHLNAFRSGVGTGLDMTVGGVDPRVALEAGARGFVANSLQGYGARHVGESYLQHEIDPLTRNLLHGAMGAGAGAIINGDDPTRGALSGAMSMFAEMGADWMNMRTPKRSIHTDTDLAAYMDDLQYQADVGRLMGATAAYALGQDVGIAAITGGTAVEFNHVGSHAAAARAELEAHQRGQSAQQGGGPDDALDEEIARITGLDETLGMLRDLGEEFRPLTSTHSENTIPILSELEHFFLKPPTPPIEDFSEAEIVKNVRAGLGRDRPQDLRYEWGAYDAPSTGIPVISSDTKAWVRELYEDAKRHDPQIAWVAKTVEDFPRDIERGVQLWRQERERSSEGFTRFVEERTWEAFSVRDALGTVAFGMWDAMREDVRRVEQGLFYVGTGIEYGKAYMRRGLRFMGMSPVVAQAVVNGAEGGAMLWAGTGAVRAGVGRIPGDVREVASIVGQQGGRQALREASGLSTVERTLLRREAVLPEVGAAGRAEEVLLWDLRGSGASLEALKLARYNQGPYNPRAMEALLRERFGAEAVTPHTFVSAGKRNAMLGLMETSHPQTGVPFDLRGFPVFDKHVVYEVRISSDAIRSGKSYIHMREATRHLKESILRGELKTQSFTERQLQAILKEKEKIPEFTWHHQQELGRMQLLPEKIHQSTAHMGGGETWKVAL